MNNEETEKKIEEEYKDRYWKEIGKYEPRIPTYQINKGQLTLLLLAILSAIGVILSLLFILFDILWGNLANIVLAVSIYDISLFLLITSLIAYICITSYRKKRFIEYKAEVDKEQEKILSLRAEKAKALRKEIEDKYKKQ